MRVVIRIPPSVVFRQRGNEPPAQPVGSIASAFLACLAQLFPKDLPKSAGIDRQSDVDGNKPKGFDFSKGHDR
jgi:hypothetical protein